MNVPPNVALNLTLWQYQAILAQWNRQHDPDGDLDIVTGEEFAETAKWLNANPQFLN